MVTQEDIETFLNRLGSEGVTYEEVEPGLCRFKPGGALDFYIVCHYSPPGVVLRVKVMEIPADDCECGKLARRLLELNATDLVHGSYGIELDSIVMTEALELSHLDYEEFLAAYEGMTLGLASHLRELSTYREGR